MAVIATPKTFNSNWGIGISFVNPSIRQTQERGGILSGASLIVILNNYS